MKLKWMALHHIFQQSNTKHIKIAVVGENNSLDNIWNQYKVVNCDEWHEENPCT